MKIVLSLSKAFGSLTEEESAKFRTWFGPSVVKDRNGDPLRCYHGTPRVFSKFDLNFAAKGNDQYGIGFYFTSNPATASTYAGETGSVLPCYLKITRPIDYDNPRLITSTQIEKLVFGLGRDNAIRAMGDHFDIRHIGLPAAVRQYVRLYQGADILYASRGIWNDVYSGHPKAGFYPRILKTVTGYDGIIARNRADGDIYVVFTPLQIKSAVGNSGGFSRTDDFAR